MRPSISTTNQISIKETGAEHKTKKVPDSPAVVRTRTYASIIAKAATAATTPPFEFCPAKGIAALLVCSGAALVVEEVSSDAEVLAVEASVGEELVTDLTVAPSETVEDGELLGVPVGVPLALALSQTADLGMGT